MSKLINSRSNWLSSDKISPYVLAGILVLAFSIRLIGLDKGIWLDEAFTIQMISKANLLEMLQDLRGDVHPPSEAGIVVGNATNIEKIKYAIDKYIAQNRDNLSSTFLIIRVELILKNENFQNFLSVLKTRFKEPLNLKIFLIISHDYCFIKERNKPNNFLAALEAEFGQPTSYQDKKVYILSEY